MNPIKITIKPFQYPILIGYAHIDKDGIQPTKPDTGFAWVVFDDGEKGLLISKEIENWNELPDLTFSEQFFPQP